MFGLKIFFEIIDEVSIHPKSLLFCFYFVVNGVSSKIFVPE